MGSPNDPTLDVASVLRPDDYVGSAHAPETSSSAAGPAHYGGGWFRWAWRQLTSMRTALVLLLMLAAAAVPGSIVPQRSADPNGVAQYIRDNPTTAPLLDGLSLFDVYSSPWFSAIYILLFASLIGCVIPRTKHHWRALRARPPRTPSRLDRFEAYRSVFVPLNGSQEQFILTAVLSAKKQLRQGAYRTEEYNGGGRVSVSAERGYARETGNLVFHVSLIGVLISVGVGGGFTYTGQGVIVEGGSFVNSLVDYTSFNPGRFVDPEELTPYSVQLNSFDVTYQPFDVNRKSSGQAGDFVANVTVVNDEGGASDGEVRVNHPLEVEGDRIYLMGNGYAPAITVRAPDGTVVFSQKVPFLPQDANMTSLGVIKVPDGLSEQLGMTGFLYPTQYVLDSGAYTSIYPALSNPVLTLNVFVGNLGIDGGTPRSVYELDPSNMRQLAGRGTDTAALELAPGTTTELPNGLGTVTFDNQSPAGQTGSEQSVERFVSLSIHKDVAAPWVLGFALLATLGLLTALFIPRRRVWVAASPQDGGVLIEYAALARGEDLTLSSVLRTIADNHARDIARGL